MVTNELFMLMHDTVAVVRWGHSVLITKEGL